MDELRDHLASAPVIPVDGVKGLDSEDFDSALAFAAAAEKSFVHQALIDSTREAIVMIDLQGHVTIENQSARRMFGELFSVGSGASFNDRFLAMADELVDPDGYREATVDLLDSDEEQVYEWRHRQTGRFFSRYSAPVLNQSGSSIGRLFVTREVTKERESERLKDEFIALVSHELRTPLTTIIGYLDLLRDEESGPINEMQDQFIQTIERNTFRLQRIVGDLLFAAQADAGRIVFEKGSCPLAEVATQCVEAAGPAADSRDIALTFSVADEPVVLGDRERLSQVLDNLITNALKFTDPQGTVEVTVSTEEGYGVFAVSDTGMGLSDEEQARLFQRFYRTDRATEQAIQGTGLGLAICKTIVEKHHGQISVHSVQDEGSTFTVRIPLLDSEERA